MKTAFTRLMWKEFRTQRMLWTTMVIGAVFFYVILRVLVAPWTASVPITIVFVFLYLAAAFAITFAAEVEDATAGLLRMLPLRTSTLILAKILAALISSVLLAAAIVILCGLMEPLFRMFTQLHRNERNSIDFDAGDVVVFLCNILLLCTASVFTSLTSKRVVSSVGMACLIVLAAYSVTITSTSHLQTSIVARWLASSSCLLIGGACLLARPWHLGRIPRQRFFGDSINTSFDRRIPSGSWLFQTLLQRIVARPASQSRVRSMLFWRELRSVIPFGLIWLAIGVVICIARSFILVGPPFTFLFLLIFVHECGQRTMRDDQRSGALSLLANIGIQPRQIWRIKIQTWFLVMCLVGLALCGLDAVFPCKTGHPAHFIIFRIVDAIRVPLAGVDPKNLRQEAFSIADRWLQAGVCLSAVLGLFSIGQLTACWFRLQIVAFGASFIAVGSGAALITAAVVFDWPIWIGVVPIPVCFLLATAITARLWIEGRATWRLRITQAALVVIPCTIFPFLAWIVWMIQPYMAAVTFSHESGASLWGVYNLQNSPTPEIAHLSAIAHTSSANWQELDNPEDAETWYHFADDFEASRLKQDINDFHLKTHSAASIAPYSIWTSSFPPVDIAPDEIHKLLLPFDTLYEHSNRVPLLPVIWTSPWSQTPAVRLTMVLLEDARKRELSGDVNGALRQIGRAIRLNHSLALQTSSWDDWLLCLQAKRAALGRMRLLLGSADLSNIDLDTLYAALKQPNVMLEQSFSDGAEIQNPTAMLQRRSLFWASALLDNESLFERIHRLPKRQQSFELQEKKFLLDEARFEAEVWGTRMRALQLMRFSQVMLEDKYRKLTTSGRTHVPSADQARSTGLQHLQRYLATSTFTDLDVDQTVLESADASDFFVSKTINTIASERATLLTIMLQKYRIVHGKFPDSLIDLSEIDRTDTLIRTDPWTGTPFLYISPNHAPPLRLEFVTSAPLITFGQPVLHTPGVLQIGLKSYVPLPTANGSIEMYKLPENVILFLGLSDGIDWRYEQIASKVTVNSDVEIESLTPARD